jgi:hypothetical protein
MTAEQQILHDKIVAKETEAQRATQEARQLRLSCSHSFIKRGDSAICEVCRVDGGWWCPSSPSHCCEYEEQTEGAPHAEESCIHCGEPDERK